ncbi:MAG: hypothetical protein WCA44_15150 [Acidobacteriaceae bacterium]|jgi:hypothetical protein
MIGMSGTGMRARLDLAFRERRVATLLTFLFAGGILFFVAEIARSWDHAGWRLRIDEILLAMLFWGFWQKLLRERRDDQDLLLLFVIGLLLLSMTAAPF